VECRVTIRLYFGARVPIKFTTEDRTALFSDISKLDCESMQGMGEFYASLSAMTDTPVRWFRLISIILKADVPIRS